MNCFYTDSYGQSCFISFKMLLVNDEQNTTRKKRFVFTPKRFIIGTDIGEDKVVVP